MAEEGSSSEIYDSLPYYDNDLERYPNLKEVVEKEFAKVPKPPSSLHPKVPPEPSLFANNPMLAAELKRVENHESLDALDSTRYQVPAPLSPDASVEDWEKAVQNARAQMEHQGLRASNVSLLQNYGANAWRVHNYLLEADATLLEKQAEQLKERVTEVNRTRKNFQTELGERLTAMERKWTDLISTVLQLELANSALESEVEGLNAKEQELSAIVNGS